MAKEYEYLDEVGLSQLAKGLLIKVNNKINERIVQSVGPDSDEQHVASALAVYRAIANARHTTIQVITGNIDELVPLEDRRTDVLYYQRDNEEDKTWMIYIWNANPELHPDPDGYWINVGDTEVDLSGYWSKSDEDMADLKNLLGVNGLEDSVSALQSDMITAQSDITSIKDDINNINEEIDGVKEDIEQINVDLSTKVDKSEVDTISSATINKILNDAERETDPFIDEAATATELVNALSDLKAGDSVVVRVSENIDMTSGSVSTIAIPGDTNVEVIIPAGTEVKATNVAFSVASGASLTLSGSGTIEKVSKTSNAAVAVENGGELTLNGVTIDCTGNTDADNWSYGVYAKNSSVINVNPGTVIKVVGASCVSTNNTTGGSTINVKGAELYSTCGYAIYNPAQGTINIEDSIVQGINARMGTINITGNSQIIDTGIDASNADDIGANLGVSGSLALGDAIALVAGSYSDPNGIDITVNVGADSTVESSYRGAIGVYMLDTKAAANVEVNVADGTKVTTSDAEAKSISVYDHAYITAAASAAGKTYNPSATSDVVVRVNGSIVYPENA